MRVSCPDYLEPSGRLFAAAGVCVLAVACNDSDPAASPGELGRASFRYECIEQVDQYCRRGGSGLPERIAVGGRFRLLSSASGAPAQPVSPEMVRTAYRDQLEFLRPGAAAFVAVDARDDDFHDFVHLFAVPATSLRVLRDTSEVSQLRIAADQSLALTVAPHRHGKWLAGSLNAVWTSSNPEVLPLSERGASANLSPAAPGSAEVTVEHGELSASVLIEVGPPGSHVPPPALGDAGVNDSGALGTGTGDGGTTTTDASADGGGQGASGPHADGGTADASETHGDGGEAGELDDAGEHLDASPSDDAGVSPSEGDNDATSPSTGTNSDGEDQ